MKNKKVIIIASASVIVFGILYFAITKAKANSNAELDAKLQQEYNDLFIKIDKAK